MKTNFLATFPGRHQWSPTSPERPVKVPAQRFFKSFWGRRENSTHCRPQDVFTQRLQNDNKTFQGRCRDVILLTGLLVWMMAWRLINAKPSHNATVRYIYFPVINMLSYPSGLGFLDYYEFLIIWFLVQCVIFCSTIFVFCLNIHLTHARSCFCGHTLSWLFLCRHPDLGLRLCPHQWCRNPELKTYITMMTQTKHFQQKIAPERFMVKKYHQKA